MFGGIFFKNSKFYVTTPIYYPTANPHIGNAYTTVIADVLARWHRQKGENVFFLTGTDEHGQKLNDTAKAAGVSPKEYTDKLVEDFKRAWKKLDIQFDGFVRTTDKHHEETVKKIIAKIYENGDLYEGEYSGLYCTPCESYWTEKDLVDGKCPECKRTVKALKEKAYFFKLSKYEEKLLDWYDKNPKFLLPASKRKEILNRINEGLRDVSFTRSKFDWGVEFPIDKKYVIWVWADALTNYLSAINWPDGKEFKEFWPADVHLVGKDILWFHSVIWPAILLSAGIEPAKTVFAHGWWTANGRKISKSLGNAVDPIEISEKYSVDAFRYFLVREMPLGDDGDFSEKALIARINGELVSDLGNLVSRVLTLAEKFDGKIEGKPELDKYLDVKKIDDFITNVDTFNAIEEIWKFIRHSNKYINENEPWKLHGKELANVLYNLLESCRIISILVSPFLPSTAQKINEQLGVKAGTLKDCKFGEFRGKPKKGAHLFVKVDESALITKKGGKGSKKDSGAVKSKSKSPASKSDIFVQEEVGKKPKVSYANQKTEKEGEIRMVNYEEFSKIDLRIGEVREAEKLEGTHLLKLKVDIGTEQRTIVSGIADWYSPEDMINKKVVVVANLEPKKIRGVESHGMLLCADSEEKAVLLTPDREVTVGSKVL